MAAIKCCAVSHTLNLKVPFIKGTLEWLRSKIFLSGTLSWRPPTMQSPFAWAFRWTSGQAGLGEEFRDAQWEMTLLPRRGNLATPSPHGWQRRDHRSTGVTSTHQAQGASLAAQGEGSACNAADLGSVPGLGRAPAGAHGSPRQYSRLQNPRDRGGWQCAVHRVTQS